MKKNILFAVIALLLVSMTGCGYTTRSALPDGLRTINIKPFPNKIAFTTNSAKEVYFPLLEIKVRNAIEDRFLFDGNLRIAREDTADMILSGELIGYEKSPLRYTDDDDVQEYRVQIIVSLVLKKGATGEEMWAENAFAGEETFFITGSQATTEASAVEAATVDLARRVVERTIENW